MQSVTVGMAFPEGMAIRRLAPDDYDFIISAVNDWWGGREMRAMLPRLFFIHFCDTSFVAEHGGNIVGFLIGFVSPSRPGQAYIHFAGVHPGHRKRKLGCALYARFFDDVVSRGCRSVRCITSPVNTGSIAFHRAMGFEVAPASAGHLLPFAPDYDGPGEHRVLFKKTLGSPKSDINQ